MWPSYPWAITQDLAGTWHQTLKQMSGLTRSDKILYVKYLPECLAPGSGIYLLTKHENLPALVGHAS